MKLNIKIFDSMKNVVILLIMIAAMSAAVSCACSNDSYRSSEVVTVECTAVECPGCDSTAVEDSNYRK